MMHVLPSLPRPMRVTLLRGPRLHARNYPVPLLRSLLFFLFLWWALARALYFAVWRIPPVTLEDVPFWETRLLFDAWLFFQGGLGAIRKPRASLHFSFCFSSSFALCQLRAYSLPSPFFSSREKRAETGFFSLEPKWCSYVLPPC